MSNRPKSRRSSQGQAPPAGSSSRPAPGRQPAAVGADRSRVLILLAAVVAVIAVLGLVIALVVGSGDEVPDAVGAVPMTDGGVADCGSVAADDVGDAATDAGTDLAAFVDGEVAQPVAVGGTDLPAFTRAMGEGSAADTALCTMAPVLSGYDYTGEQVTIDARRDGPTMVVLLAHWCPHCNAEIPVLNEWRDSGEVPDGLNIVGVSTAVSPDRPNYPPDQWLRDRDWQWPVIADDGAGTQTEPPPALAAYGGGPFPMMVLLDGDGLVRLRFSGETPLDRIAAVTGELVAVG